VSQDDWVLVLGHTTNLHEVTARIRAKLTANQTPSMELFDDLSFAILQTYHPTICVYCLFYFVLSFFFSGLRTCSLIGHAYYFNLI
jgi:hypothetical protein